MQVVEVWISQWKQIKRKDIMLDKLGLDTYEKNLFLLTNGQVTNKMSIILIKLNVGFIITVFYTKYI